MVYRVRKDCAAIQQQAYWCEPSKENVKQGLGRKIHEEAGIIKKTRKVQASS
jgi:hypothetical protein